MERTAYSVSAENCPGSKQENLINSGNSCSASSSKEASTTCQFYPGGAPRKAAGRGLGQNGVICECFPAYNPNVEGPQWAWLAPWRAEVPPGKAALVWREVVCENISWPP